MLLQLVASIILTSERTLVRFKTLNPHIGLLYKPLSTGTVAYWYRVGLVIQCFHVGRGSIPTPGVYSAAIPLGKELTVH